MEVYTSLEALTADIVSKTRVHRNQTQKKIFSEYYKFFKVNKNKKLEKKGCVVFFEEGSTRVTKSER